MREMSELLFYLTAYPWFLVCFLLTLSLLVLSSRFGYRWQFVAERYFAWLLLRDLDVYLGTGKLGYEPQAPESEARDLINRFCLVYFDHCDPSRVLILREIQRATEGSGVKLPPRDGLVLQKPITDDRNGVLFP